LCKKAGLLFGWDNDNKRVYVAHANCDSWNCEECRIRMAENWGLRAALGCVQIIQRGEQLDFVTITSHEKLATFQQTESVWRDAWATLYAALKRQKRDLCYMIVPERHKDGRMHVHALWNAGVSQKWLKDNARKRGLGYQCKIIHVSAERHAQKYIVKYVGKDIGSDAPPHFRRVRVSDNWANIPKPNTVFNGLRWEYIGTNGALQIVYEQCAERKITIIDAQTGELFDDVDLGTIVSYA